jgi:hypothetical protein
MAGLDPDPLDQLGRGRARLRKLLARALAERGRERVDLTSSRRRVGEHDPMEARATPLACADTVTISPQPRR